MNRRSLIKMVSAGVAGSSVCCVTRASATGDSKRSAGVYPDRYRDFLILWTGWKGAQSSDRLVGQWLAYEQHPGKRSNDIACIYSSTPGKSGRFVKGDSFDTTCCAPQAFITHQTPDIEKDRAMQVAFDVLIKEIDGFYV